MSDGLKFAVEALLFASEKPLSAEEIKIAFDEQVSLQDIQASLALLKQDYETQERGFYLTEIATVRFLQLRCKKLTRCT